MRVAIPRIEPRRLPTARAGRGTSVRASRRLRPVQGVRVDPALVALGVPDVGVLALGTEQLDLAGGGPLPTATAHCPLPTAHCADRQPATTRSNRSGRSHSPAG